ncbi:hypothetical protein Gotur_034230 [Gossypium turneri]
MSGTWHGHRYENSHVRPYLGYGIGSTGNVPCKTIPRHRIGVFIRQGYHVRLCQDMAMVSI